MNKITNQHTVWHEPSVYRNDREKMNGHKSVIIWFTGLSGAGKTTMAHALEDTLHKNKVRTYVLDGDNIRVGLNNDLGFTDEGRKENIRRIAEVSRLMIDAGLIVITAFISPFDEERELAKSLVLENNYFLVHINCSVAKCEEDYMYSKI